MLVKHDGAAISVAGYKPQRWYLISVPTTVLNALVKNGVYPDVRFALNAFRVPDASDAFNEKENLARFSHLPEHRNPWTDPWWFRTTFTLSPAAGGTCTWLHFDSINYRAEVWLNGNKVADCDRMVGMNRRFTFDVSRWALPGANCLAVKVWRVDHVGSPGTQLVPLAGNRFEDHASDGPMDYAVQLAGGYDCFPTVPDRYMGILEDVWVETSGPVTIRDPFIVTQLPLPRTDAATLKISATLSNAADTPTSGVLEGSIPGEPLSFQVPVTLQAGQSKVVAIDPAPVLKNPKLWWPNGYGDHPLYDLDLRFVVDGIASHAQRVGFGVRQITTELHEHNGHFGRQILVNGQKIFARGGYIQPDALWDWTAARIDAEIRYYADANLNLVYFEDVANPPDWLFDACDRYGMMIGQCFYGCSWMQSGSKYPGDIPLVIQCTRDILNPLSQSSGTGHVHGEQRRHDPRRGVPSVAGERHRARRKPFLGSFQRGMPNVKPERVPEWFRADVPTGMTDNGGNSYGWLEPAEYYRRVRLCAELDVHGRDRVGLRAALEQPAQIHSAAGRGRSRPVVPVRCHVGPPRRQPVLSTVRRRRAVRLRSAGDGGRLRLAMPPAGHRRSAPRHVRSRQSPALGHHQRFHAVEDQLRVAGRAMASLRLVLKPMVSYYFIKCAISRSISSWAGSNRR